MKIKKHIGIFVAILCAAVISFSFFACSPAGDIPDATPPPDEITMPVDPSSPSEPTDPSEPDKPEQPLWASTFELPDADVAMQKLVEIYGDASKVFLLQNGRIARMPCPQGEAISLNMRYEVNGYVKLILEDCVQEFNEVFAVINPNYVFKINYSPDEADFAAKYSVRMSASNALESSDTREVFGFANISYYNNYTELGNFGITIRSDVFDNGSYLMTTFKHELMHLLGAGDAYKNGNATKATIMQSYTVSGYRFFSESDVRFLDALYRNPAAPYTDEQIAEYISGYEQNCTHTQNALTAAVYDLLVQNTSAQSVITQASDIGYADISGFVREIENDLNRDETFGTANISFTELAYAETPETTYFGSFDVGKTYWHGVQKGGMGNSQGIKYIDYGNGLLYAAPNGNIYTVFIKLGGYVVLFDLDGSFTNIPELSLAVRTVCSVG